MAAWVAITGLVLALLGIAVLLYFAAPIFTAILQFLQLMVKYLAMAPRAVQIFVFVFTFGAIASLFVMVFVGNNVVCTDLSGGTSPKPYDLGITGAMTAKALPEGVIDYTIGSTEKTGMFSSVTGKIASWFLPSPSNVVGSGTHAWGTFFTNSNAVGLSDGSTNYPVLFVPADADEIEYVDSYLDKKTGTGKMMFAICQNSQKACRMEPYLPHSTVLGFFQTDCGGIPFFDDTSIMKLDYNIKKQIVSGKTSYVIGVDGVLNNEEVDGVTDICSSGGTSVRLGTNLKQYDFNGVNTFTGTVKNPWLIEGKYIAIDGEVGSGVLIKSEDSIVGMRGAFVQNYADQEGVTLTPVKPDTFFSYSCDKEANTTALFLGLDLFNFKTMLILTVFGAIFAVASALGLFR